MAQNDWVMTLQCKWLHKDCFRVAVQKSFKGSSFVSAALLITWKLPVSSSPSRLYIASKVTSSVASYFSSYFCLVARFFYWICLNPLFNGASSSHKFSVSACWIAVTQKHQNKLKTRDAFIPLAWNSEDTRKLCLSQGQRDLILEMLLKTVFTLYQALLNL